MYIPIDKPTEPVCTLEQRKQLEDLIGKKGISYTLMLGLASSLFDRLVTDVGQLSKKEATRLKIHLILRFNAKARYIQDISI